MELQEVCFRIASAAQVRLELACSQHLTPGGCLVIARRILTSPGDPEIQYLHFPSHARAMSNPNPGEVWALWDGLVSPVVERGGS